MVQLYDSFISNEKIAICFHKSCVDGLFSTIIFLEKIKHQSKETFSYSNYILVPLSPTDVSNKTNQVKNLEKKKKIILDLPFFGNNVEYYFDHHITNKKSIPIEGFKGAHDVSAASTCSVLANFFKIKDEPELEQIIEIADIIDQAKFTTAPPISGILKLESKQDIIWACNDLIKDVRKEEDLIKLLDNFDVKNLPMWLVNNKKHIQNYRRRRDETLKFKYMIDTSPIVLITNNTYSLQAESLHFALSSEEKEYKMLILLDKMKKSDNTSNKVYKATFRLNPNLDEKWTEKLRVDRIASELGGGGHKGAASAVLSEFGHQYKKIFDWIKDLQKYFENNSYFSEYEF